MFQGTWALVKHTKVSVPFQKHYTVGPWVPNLQPGSSSEILVTFLLPSELLSYGLRPIQSTEKSPLQIFERAEESKQHQGSTPNLAVLSELLRTKGKPPAWYCWRDSASQRFSGRTALHTGIVQCLSPVTKVVLVPFFSIMVKSSPVKEYQKTQPSGYQPYIILNEVSQTERQILYDITYMWNLKK